MKWNVFLGDAAQAQLLNIKDSRIRDQIYKRIKALANDPDKQGKSLGDNLIDYRSVRAVKERYRIIYKVDKDIILVLVVLVGIRKEGDKKDVYAMAQKLARLGLLDFVPPQISPSMPDSDEQADIMEEE